MNVKSTHHLLILFGAFLILSCGENLPDRPGVISSSEDAKVKSAEDDGDDPNMVVDEDMFSDANGDQSEVSSDPNNSEESASEIVTVLDERCSIDDQESSSMELRLKGVDLLSRAFSSVLGPQVVINVSNPAENLLEVYQNSFGGNEGLGYGNLYSDNLTESTKMTGYFLSLNSVAYNASIQCQYSGQAGKCKCDTEESAFEMLSRAIPYRNFCIKENAHLVKTFSELCKSDYVSAVSALMGSVAFAKRN